MEYLSDAELVLLLLIAEHPGITGYAIRRLVTKRGLGAWAGVASSSIYLGLKRVEERGLATSEPDLSKRARGPRGQLFRITTVGGEALKYAVQEGLSITRENDPRFNIALSGIEMVTPSQAAEALSTRAAFLTTEEQRLRATREAQPDRGLAADLLFDRIINSIAAERAWTVSAATQLTRERA